MPVSFEEMEAARAMPMAAVYSEIKVTPKMVAQVRKAAMKAFIEKPVKVSGVKLDETKLPKNLKIVYETSTETLLMHKGIDHRTRLDAAEAVAQEMALKPVKQVGVDLSVNGILADVLKEIDGCTRGIPSAREKAEDDE